MPGQPNSQGFTLVEVMVAITILAGLSLLTSQAIQNGVFSRNKFSREIAQDSVVRDVLRVMERDINMAFHHRDIYTAMLNDIEKEKTSGTTPGGSADKGQTPPGSDNARGALNDSAANPFFQQPGANENMRKPPKKLTAFMGDASSVNFTTLSNVRLERDARQSDQAEVGYYTRDCKSRDPGISKKGAVTSKCLVRRLSPHIDDDVTQGGNEVVLLEHVQEFKIRYFGPEREDWVEAWKTGDGGDAISKENFPLAVEVVLTVHNKGDPKAKKVTMTLVAPLRFPNNPPKKKEGAQPGAPL